MGSFSLIFNICFTPVWPHWHVKDSGHFAKSAGGRSHLNMHTPLTKQSWSERTILSRHSVGTYRANKFTCNSSGNTQPQSSQLTETLWPDSGHKRVELVCRNYLHFVKKQRRGINCHQTFLQNFHMQGRSLHLCVFHTSLNTDMKYRICNVHMWSFDTCVYTWRQGTLVVIHHITFDLDKLEFLLCPWQYWTLNHWISGQVPSNWANPQH